MTANPPAVALTLDELLDRHYQRAYTNSKRAERDLDDLRGTPAEAAASSEAAAFFNAEDVAAFYVDALLDMPEGRALEGQDGKLFGDDFPASFPASCIWRLYRHSTRLSHLVWDSKAKGDANAYAVARFYADQLRDQKHYFDAVLEADELEEVAA